MGDSQHFQAWHVENPMIVENLLGQFLPAQRGDWIISSEEMDIVVVSDIMFREHFIKKGLQKETL